LGEYIAPSLQMSDGTIMIYDVMRSIVCKGWTMRYYTWHICKALHSSKTIFICVTVLS